MKKVDKKLIIGLVLIFFGLFGLFSAPLGAIIVILGGVALVVVGAKGTVAKNPTPKAPAARPYQPPVVPFQPASPVSQSTTAPVQAIQPMPQSKPAQQPHEPPASPVSRNDAINFTHIIEPTVDGAILRYRYDCKIEKLTAEQRDVIQKNANNPAVLDTADPEHVNILLGGSVVGSVDHPTHARMIRDFERDKAPVLLLFHRINGDTAYYYLLFYSRKMQAKAVSLTGLKSHETDGDNKRFENFSNTEVGAYLDIEYNEENEHFVVIEMSIGSEIGLLPKSCSDYLDEDRRYIGQVIDLVEDEDEPVAKIKVWY